MDHRAFVGRNVALGRVDHHVERRILDPRLPDPVVEVEAVHLHPDQVPVDLLGVGPVVRPQRLQPHPPARELVELGRHCIGRIVGDTVHEVGHLEVAPLLEEHH